jgi:hypothetical protein
MCNIMRVLVLLMAGMSLFAQESSYRWIRQLGGSQDNIAIGVAVDSEGNTYVAGSTNSPDRPPCDRWSSGGPAEAHLHMRLF